MAVSAVTARSPFTIAPTRVAGTRSAIASAFTDRLSGFRNSSAMISPGWVVMRLGVIGASSVIVHDLDLGRTVGGPHEANSPLVVDPDAVLALPGAGERFEMIGRR